MKLDERPSWSRRWLVVRMVLLWSAFVATYIVVWGPSDSLRETAFIAISGLAGAVVTGYLGFATYDDRNYRDHLRRRSARGPPSPRTEDTTEEDSTL